ncbi:N-acetyl-beta-D-galactosaminidase [Aureococcus anophagefferens]|nr:N-acetyl-beta-D-galactosaminidase [Aureococcus anophagefferens]
MEASKLNVFHWHLTDAESVPVALAALPAAAAAGAFAPAATYDAAAVATVVAHAAARGIRVVPEFDTPAHAGGFFLAAGPVLRRHRADAVLDPAGGGLRVSTKCWNASASVRAWLAARNATVDSLYGYYEARAVAIAARAGRAPMAWDEAFSDPVARGLDRARDRPRWNGPGGSPVASDPRLAAAVAAGFRAVSSHGFYLTAGDGVDADLVVEWEHLYDRDLAAPLGENGSSPLLLGAEAALWGEKIDHRTVDAVAWPRAAVFAARLWSPDAAFTPGNYTRPSGASSSTAAASCAWASRRRPSTRARTSSTAARPGSSARRNVEDRVRTARYCNLKTHLF